MTNENSGEQINTTSSQESINTENQQESNFEQNEEIKTPEQTINEFNDAGNKTIAEASSFVDPNDSEEQEAFVELKTGVQSLLDEKSNELNQMNDGNNIEATDKEINLKEFDYSGYLQEYLELDENDINRIGVNNMNEIISNEKCPENYKKQFEHIGDERLEQVKIGVIPDDLWRKGGQPSESHAEKQLILFRESYYNQKKDPDQEGWMSHELAHCRQLLDSDQEEYENGMEQSAYDDIESEYSYPNNIVEKSAFEEQFKYLKDEGSTRQEVVQMLKNHYGEEDFKFFNKVLDDVYSVDQAEKTEDQSMESKVEEELTNQEIIDEIESEMSVYKRYDNKSESAISKGEIDQFAEKFFDDKDKKEEFYNLLDEIKSNIGSTKDSEFSNRYDLILNNMLRHQISIENKGINGNLRNLKFTIAQIDRLKTPMFSDLIEEDLPYSINDQISKDTNLSVQKIKKLSSSILMEASSETNVCLNDDGEVDKSRITQQFNKIMNNNVLAESLGKHMAKKMMRSRELFLKDVDNKEEISVEKLNEKKFEHIDRVVGLTDENKDEFIKEYESVNSKATFEQENEVPKTKEMIEDINIANEAANELVKKYRGKTSDIPIDNISTIPRLGKIGGQWDSLTNRINVDANLSRKDFMESVFHELIHSKFYNSLKISNTKDGITIGADQSGIFINTPDGGLGMLHGINEAVTQHLAEKFIDDCYKKGILSEKDAEDVRKNMIGPPYMNEMIVFDSLVKKIYNADKGSYKNEAEVKENFIKATANGDVNAIKRMVENSLGKGKFGMFANAESYYKNSQIFV